MARTRWGGRVSLNPRSTSPRPPLRRLDPPIFHADMGMVNALQIDEDSVILTPCDIDDADEVESGRWRENNSGEMCWKVTTVHEQKLKGEGHACIVPYKRQDLYTAFPIMAKPSGPPLDQFLNQHGEKMYTAPLDAPSSRIKPEYLPLIYQWALQMIAGLAFVHSHDVIFGDINTAHCWLSSDYRLSLVAFLNAGWNNGRVVGWWEGIYDSHPAGQKDPSMETDLMLYGWTVYELMTAFIPSTRSMPRSWKPPTRESWQQEPWPRLGDDCLGDIVRRCCSGKFESAEEVKTEVVQFLAKLGWEVDGNYCLKALETATLFP